MAYWLVKSEPEKYSIDDLARDGRTEWSGVRNYVARNFMVKEMKAGEKVLFYHSNTTPPGVVGLARICQAAHPDSTQFEPKSEYFDPKASPEKPIWHCVDVEFLEKFSNPVSLNKLREAKELSKMLILQKGNRLSVTPVTEREFLKILELAGSNSGRRKRK